MTPNPEGDNASARKEVLPPEVRFAKQPDEPGGQTVERTK